MRTKSELQRGAGDGLRREFQAQVLGADPIDAFGHNAHRQVRPVAFATQVAQVQMPQAVGDDLFDRIRGGFVGEMAVPT